MTVAFGKKIALTVSAGFAFAVAVPAQAADVMHVVPQQAQSGYADMEFLDGLTANHSDKRYRSRRYYRDSYYYDDDDDDDDDDRYERRRYRGEPIYRDTRIWRGRDGRYYCRKEDGTTGLLIGAGVGALAGRELAGRGDRTLGALLGAVGGALLGREIDRSNSRCR